MRPNSSLFSAGLRKTHTAAGRRTLCCRECSNPCGIWRQICITLLMPVPHLFLAALKSGSHPTKCGLCVPVFGFRLGGGFSNFDKLRSKDVLVPESKAFVSYLQEMLKICDRNKASALLATEMDIGHLRSIVKEELRRGWLGHSKVMSWKDTAIGDVLWGDGGNCTWGGALHVFIDIFIDNVFVDDVQPLSVSALYVFGVSVIVPGFDVVA